MSLNIRLAVRDWDYLTPILLGDVRSSRLNVIATRVGALVPHVGKESGFEAAEMSFSLYAQQCHDNDRSVVGIPNFIMRGFRHRCVITSKDSTISSFEQLRGKNIGVTGWRDSGNTWTRAALRSAGVGIEDVRWFAGRLTADHPIVDRIGGFARPGRIDPVPGERPMLELLESGELDAVFTPFMPAGFFSGNSRFRPVIEDFRQAEINYFNQVGYVPGMHLIGIKSSVSDENPWVSTELSELLDESRRVWGEKRARYADTTPWLIDEIGRSSRDLPADWDASGFEVNEKMIASFAEELHTQQILPRVLTPRELFPTEV